MPIRPQFRYLYPIDWRQLSAFVRFERARGRCEGCHRPHGQTVQHTGDGRWWDEAAQLWRNGRGRPMPRYAPPAEVIRRTRVVLATAHRDHDPTHNAQANLRALCQRCHMLHDRPEHQRRRKATLWQRNRQRRAMGDLFTGSYC